MDLADLCGVVLQEWLGTRELPVNSALFTSVVINKWEVAYPRAVAPPALAFHAAFSYGSQLVVFGGIRGAPFAAGIAFSSSLSPYLLNAVRRRALVPHSLRGCGEHVRLRRSCR